MRLLNLSDQELKSPETGPDGTHKMRLEAAKIKHLNYLVVHKMRFVAFFDS
jgi:hypothetical protein